MKAKLIRIFIYLLVIYPIIKLQEQAVDLTTQIANECKNTSDKKRVKQFSDCFNITHTYNHQVCCYLYGVNADKSHTEGCIAVNSDLFWNKSISYSSAGISGNLICTDDFSANNYIYISILNIFLLFIFLL